MSGLAQTGAGDSTSEEEDALADVAEELRRVESSLEDLRTATERLAGSRHRNNIATSFAVVRERTRILRLARVSLAASYPGAWEAFDLSVHSGESAPEGLSPMEAPTWAFGPRAGVYGSIETERKRQDEQWGGWSHDDIHTDAMWVALIAKHAGRAIQAGAFLRQMTVVATIAVAAIEAFGRARERAHASSARLSPDPEDTSR